MFKLLLTGSLLSGLIVTATETPESLQTVSTRIGTALKKGDWDAFRRDATASVSVEEHWRGYDLYFSKEGKGMRPTLGFAEDKSVSYSTVLPNQSSLSKQQSLLFRSFCKEMKSAAERHSDGWGPWPMIEEKFGKHTFDSLSISGPCLHGTVASNLDVVVEMQMVGGKWKAHRLLVLGH